MQAPPVNQDPKKNIPSEWPNRRPRRGDVFELVIERTGDEGEGIAAHLRHVAGLNRRFRMRVAGALPGETVSARVTSSNRDDVELSLEAVVIPSPDRVLPVCPHAVERPACGGCAFQALAPTAQLRAKHARLKLLLPIPGAVIRSPIGSPDVFRYRNKLELSFGRAVSPDLDSPAVLALGLRPRGFRHEVVSLRECHLVSEAASRLIPAFGEWARAHGLVATCRDNDDGFLQTLTFREGRRTGDRLLELTTTGADTAVFDGAVVTAETVAESFADHVAQLASMLDAPVSGVVWTRRLAVRGSPTRLESTCLAGRSTLFEELVLPGGRLRFEIHPRAFFQPNTLATELLYAHVIEATGLQAGYGQRALDLYCGTGTIALALSGFVREVIGIDLVTEAISNAEANARLNGITNARFVAGDAPVVARSLGLEGQVDVVVVDPPRAGLSSPSFSVLAGLAAPRLVYVSCNPISLARDLPELGKVGYRVAYAQPLDPFPHTPHVETVVALDLHPA